MRVLIAGAGGQLGMELAAWLRRHRPEWTVHAYRRDAWNVACRCQTEALVRALRPDAIVNCAAFTQVDACEMRRVTALRVNAVAPGLLARAAEAVGARLVHISTDYVFDGEKGGCYVEHDVPRPLNTYGWSKLRGEEAVLAAWARHLVVRTAWLYGPHGPNFAQRVLDRLRRGEPVAVVRDVIGPPTHTWDLARFLAEVLPTDATGIVHAANAALSF
ncbi:dTDP-4-dehydrorhamnose reductase [Calditerricola satsumensis]|uniref:dTDP-4-dehydrorhamnose reductase n=1 Tax=Calditerricola satsumensis TaxID=373054 RepID=UPI0016692468|nr:dTDP-4-dehydrorhamnose reductase [Calditerricola satsumensis]